MSILIKNGRVVTAVDDYYADVFIDGEKVAQIGKNLNVQADEVIDATDRLVLPGGIDPHTHMDMPFGGTNSADDFESGTIAAAFGGTTTIVDFAIQTKGSFQPFVRFTFLALVQTGQTCVNTSQP